MNAMSRLFLFVALVVTSQAAWAQVLPGEVLLESPFVSGRELQSGREFARLDVVDVQGQRFDRAVRVSVQEERRNWWDVEVKAPVPAAVEVGDVLLFTAWVRLLDTDDESGEAVVTAYVQKASPGYDKAFVQQFGAAGDWVEVNFPFRMTADYAAGEAELGLGFATERQTVEVGAVTLTRYPVGTPLDQLPRTQLTYPGREPDAAWRREAEARIERYRKADLTVEVTDSAGRPVEGAAVEVAMRRHAYGFGTAVSAPLVLGPEYSGGKRVFTAEDRQRYLQTLGRLFNTASPENVLKIESWTGEWGAPHYGRENALTVVRTLNDMGLDVRGHVLVWPGWTRFRAPCLDVVKDHPEALAAFVLDHVRDEAGALRGQMAAWDVINEPYRHHDVIDVVGREAMIDWFQAAREADPDALLFINETQILPGDDVQRQDAYYETVRYLLDGGAPVDGIGMQGHFRGAPTPPERVLEILDRFGELGPQLDITEFDFDTADEAVQADYTRDFMTAVFSHPATRSFTMWGFWEGAHWRPTAALFTRDWQPKPNAEAYQDLVLNRWWTDEQGTTDRAGRYGVRGFHGAYDVTVRAEGKTERRTVTLGPEGQAVRVALGP